MESFVPNPEEDQMPLTAFDPPGFLADLDAAQKRRWSDKVSKMIDDAMATAAAHNNHYYNELKKPNAADVKTADIPWTAFPRLVKTRAPSNQARWQQADETRDVQDEYCEWSVTRDNSGKITKVTFTCESPDYWVFLAKQNPAKVLSLYQQFISPNVTQQDLFPDGQYEPKNKWNSTTTDGAMHLIQDANNLFAEVTLAVQASIVRHINGADLTDAQKLIGCGQYGTAGRNSDPTIGAGVNEFAREKGDIAIANPVALYIRDLDTSGWQAPDGSDPKQFWKIVRGTADHAVRAVYEVPTTKGFAVGDITINDQTIDFGAQIADFITIKVIGQACRFGQSTVPPVTQCVDQAAAVAAAPLAMAAAGGRGPR
jgi:hypothetical protein